MPVLPNSRHEIFAQELAKGKSASEAYVTAGFKANDGNAIRLKGNERVGARVAEIIGRAAIRAEISVASITADLLRIAEKSEKLGEAPGLSVARAAMMDAAKLNGLIVDRSESQNTNVSYVVSGEPVDDVEEWAAQHGPSAH